MILVVDMNWKKDSLGFYEFVLPIVAIAKTQDECSVKHFLEVTTKPKPMRQDNSFRHSTQGYCNFKSARKVQVAQRNRKAGFWHLRRHGNYRRCFRDAFDSMFRDRYDTDKNAKRKPTFP